MRHKQWIVTLTLKKNKTVRVVARDAEEAEEMAADEILDSEPDSEVIGSSVMIDYPELDDL